MSAPEPESIEALLLNARRSIERGELSIKQGIEQMAEAEQLGASNRAIGKAVGKSASWVNRMLKWRKGGYRDQTPFGPQSKEARRRKAPVEATEQNEERGSTADELLQSNPIKSPGPVREEAPAGRTCSNGSSSRQLEETDNNVTRRRPDMSQEQRRLLVEALDSLSASDGTESANAAGWVEKHRSAINLSWDELIVPADEPGHQIRLLSDQSAGKVAHG